MAIRLNTTQRLALGEDYQKELVTEWGVPMEAALEMPRGSRMRRQAQSLSDEYDISYANALYLWEVYGLQTARALLGNGCNISPGRDYEFVEEGNTKILMPSNLVGAPLCDLEIVTLGRGLAFAAGSVFQEECLSDVLAEDPKRANLLFGVYAGRDTPESAEHYVEHTFEQNAHLFFW